MIVKTAGKKKTDKEKITKKAGTRSWDCADIDYKYQR